MLQINKIRLQAVVAAVIPFVIVGLSLAIASNSGATSPMVRLVLYTPACTISKGETVDLIVEVSNGGKEVVKCSDYVSLERIVEESPNGVHREATKVEHIDPEGVPGEIHLKITCSVPPGCEEKAIAPRNTNGSTRPLREVLPNSSIFIKVPMPSDAFELGTCNLSVATLDRVASSNALRIQCFERTTDAAKGQEDKH